MARIISIHEVDLLPGADVASFERFMTNEFCPSIQAWDGWMVRLAKADRGERSGKYGLVFELDTTARDRITPAHNQFTEESQRLIASAGDLDAKFATYSSTVPGKNTCYTDYVILGT
ncbi:hypothetical protein [Sphaerotilus sp.]|uniref:hypothetical protein n=1 Tax=Sphaerotilus sp. TaxID=2093942 RepID=UPI00286EA9C6|nr:hypothetical protein [Sphaerotilus sp.]